MTSILCLILYIVDIRELRKARLYGKISVFYSPNLSIYLGNWGMLGMVGVYTIR